MTLGPSSRTPSYPLRTLYPLKDFRHLLNNHLNLVKDSRILFKDTLNLFRDSRNQGPLTRLQNTFQDSLHGPLVSLKDPRIPFRTSAASLTFELLCYFWYLLKDPLKNQQNIIKDYFSTLKYLWKYCGTLEGILEPLHGLFEPPVTSGSFLTALKPKDTRYLFNHPESSSRTPETPSRDPGTSSF